LIIHEFVDIFLNHDYNSTQGRVEMCTCWARLKSCRSERNFWVDSLLDVIKI